MREERMRQAAVIGGPAVNDPFVEFGVQHGDDMQDLLVEALEDLRISLEMDPENWEITKGFFTVETMENILKDWAQFQLAKMEEDHSERPQCGGRVK